MFSDGGGVDFGVAGEGAVVAGALAVAGGLDGGADFFGSGAGGAGGHGDDEHESRGTAFPEKTHLSGEHRAMQVGILKVLLLNQRLDLSYRDTWEANMPNGLSAAAVPESCSMDHVKPL